MTRWARNPNFGDNLGSLAPLRGERHCGTDFKIKDWLDVSLLPAFDKVSKYFYFSVYGASTTPEAINFKAFAPVPPQLKK